MASVVAAQVPARMPMPVAATGSRDSNPMTLAISWTGTVSTRMPRATVESSLLATHPSWTALKQGVAAKATWTASTGLPGSPCGTGTPATSGPGALLPAHVPFPNPDD